MTRSSTNGQCHRRRPRGKHEAAAQNVKSRTLPSAKLQNAGDTPRLNRKSFHIGRELDYLSRKELIAQTGHQPREWPVVLEKELLDNALDAIDEKGVAPKVSVTVDRQGITISDNGPGIPPEVVEGVLDFTNYVSSRAAYCSTDRGCQGNALKTILAMPYVLSGDLGRVVIEARGIRHDISIRADRIRQKPIVEGKKTRISAKNGTSVFVAWSNSPSSITGHSECGLVQNGDSAREATPDSPGSILANAKERFLQIADDYTWLNPHLALALNWHGERLTLKASDSNWEKWTASDPTDPHWYGTDELERLLAAHLANNQDPTVREFIAEFRGLSGSRKQKRVLSAAGLARARLSDLASGDELDKGAVTKLLEAMQANTRPVKPLALGVIGSDHLAKKCAAAGAEMKSFVYRKVQGRTKGLPWVMETAFAWCPRSGRRRIITGVNWSPGIINPFRQLGLHGKSLDSILEEQRAGRDEPTVLVLHIACPRVSYADRGKSSVIVED